VVNGPSTTLAGRPSTARKRQTGISGVVALTALQRRVPRARAGLLSTVVLGVGPLATLAPVGT